jgi:hypothetical protein
VLLQVDQVVAAGSFHDAVRRLAERSQALPTRLGLLAVLLRELRQRVDLPPWLQAVQPHAAELVAQPVELLQAALEHGSEQEELLLHRRLGGTHLASVDGGLPGAKVLPGLVLPKQAQLLQRHVQLHLLLKVFQGCVWVWVDRQMCSRQARQHVSQRRACARPRSRAPASRRPHPATSLANSALAPST